MIIYILINIAIVLLILGIDLYRHRFRQLKFSSILLSILINSVIDIFAINQFNFITMFTVTLFMIWTLLQIYLNFKLYPFTDKSSTQSVYMSIPYLSPTIFIIGAILLFVGTFKIDEVERLSLFRKIKRPMTTGTIIIILSLISTMILTPFWYVFLIIYSLLIGFILWQGVFFIKDKK